jgi:hypothetical protein
MNTKILIGSIGVVAILILVSFTNVVGIQSTTSDSISNSPLFNIRTQKAINQGSKTVLTSNYLGKGLNAIQFPLRDNRTALIEKIIEIIEKMDDKEFNRFQSLILSRFYEEKKNLNIDASQLITILKQFKSNTRELKIILNNNGNNSKNDPPTLILSTVACGCFSYQYNPHCYRNIIIALAIALTLYILFLPELLLFNFIAHLLTVEYYCAPYKK